MRATALNPVREGLFRAIDERASAVHPVESGGTTRKQIFHIRVGVRQV
ncbi:MAG: hypothetical protein GVY25_04010 [Bacteroidetes bacterium]|jgi:predicted RNase H-like nuclease|nr:hypothetical protein [Bacteroidota bacterium]